MGSMGNKNDVSSARNAKEEPEAKIVLTTKDS